MSQLGALPWGGHPFPSRAALDGAPVMGRTPSSDKVHSLLKLLSFTTVPREVRKEVWRLLFVFSFHPEKNIKQERGGDLLSTSEPRGQGLLPTIPDPTLSLGPGCPLPQDGWAQKGLGSQAEVDWQPLALPKPTR